MIGGWGVRSDILDYLAKIQPLQSPIHLIL